MTFSDISNTRYHSYCNAATVILLYLKHFLAFIQHIYWNKEKPKFNHLEENCKKGLQDLETRTELITMAAYSQVLCKPYAHAVCKVSSEGLNILNLEPLHEKVKSHVKKI